MLYTTTTQNAIQKVTTAPLLAGDTTAIYLFDMVGISNAPGVFVIDRVNSAGVDTPGDREYIIYTGTSGSSLIGLTRNADGSGTDKTHSAGAIVEFVPDVLWAQGIKDALNQVVDDNGNILSSIGKATPGTAGNVLTSNGTNWVSSPASSGFTVHSSLTGLDYASAGHIGFVPDTRTVNGYGLATNVTLTLETFLTPGTSGNLITSNGTIWQSLPAPVSVSVTTKGDLQGYSTLPARIPVGSNGQILAANSSVPLGIEWIAAPSTSPLTTKGDLYTYSTTNARLALGTTSQVLSVNASLSSGLEWVYPVGTNSFISDETPSGTVNGSNTTFTLVSTPVTGTLQLYRDGQLMKGGGADYTLTTNSISFVTAPVTGSVLTAFYQSVASTAGNADTLDGFHASTFTDTALTGWYAISDSWSYASADAPTFTITVPSGAASKYTAGMRIKLTQTTVKYFIVTAVADTVLTVYGGTDYTLANAAISNVSVSNVKAPMGFPLDPTKWTVEVKDTSDRTQSSPAAGTWYNINSQTISVPIGIWELSYQVSAYPYKLDVESSQFVTLSTTNNGSSDSDFDSYLYYLYTASTQYLGGAATVYRQKVITAASKTSYYLNSKSGQAVYQIAIYGSKSPTIIRAVCAYL